MFSFNVLITVPHWACSLVLLHVCTQILILILIYIYIERERERDAAEAKLVSVGLAQARPNNIPVNAKHCGASLSIDTRISMA